MDSKHIKPKAKPEAVKTIKDTFTFPEVDHDMIAELIKDAMALGVGMNKSEIIRAGLHALSKLSDGEKFSTLQSVEPTPRGRRRKVQE